MSEDDVRAFVIDQEDRLNEDYYDVRRSGFVSQMVAMVDDEKDTDTELWDDNKVFREGFWKHPVGEKLIDVMSQGPVARDYAEMSKEDLLKAIQKRDEHIDALGREALSICGKFADMKLGVLKMTDHGWYNEKKAEALMYPPENEATKALAQLKRAAEEEAGRRTPSGRLTPSGRRSPSGRRTPAKKAKLE